MVQPEEFGVLEKYGSRFMETTGSNNSPPRFTPKRNENIGLHRNLHKNIHSSIIHKSPQNGNPNVHQLMYEQNVLYSYNGALVVV